MFYFHIWYRNQQNFSLSREDEQCKHVQCFWYKFSSSFGVSEDLKLCFEPDWESFFCINLILMYVKCSLFDFLFAFKNLYCVATAEDVSIGETVKFVSGSSSIANLGLFWKLKIQCKYGWLNSNRICKCKPTIDCSEIPLKIT